MIIFPFASVSQVTTEPVRFWRFVYQCIKYVVKNHLWTEWNKKFTQWPRAVKWVEWVHIVQGNTGNKILYDGANPLAIFEALSTNSSHYTVEVF
jgi:3-methyladenine DNA glycosylase AlkD